MRGSDQRLPAHPRCNLKPRVNAAGVIPAPPGLQNCSAQPKTCSGARSAPGLEEEGQDGEALGREWGASTGCLAFALKN